MTSQNQNHPKQLYGFDTPYLPKAYKPSTNCICTNQDSCGNPHKIKPGVGGIGGFYNPIYTHAFSSWSGHLSLLDMNPRVSRQYVPPSAAYLGCNVKCERPQFQQQTCATAGYPNTCPP